MKINIIGPSQVFADHIAKPENEQILFSAQFGFGKTYFLEQFFNENIDYYPFWLSPVKYVVGQNEDIFEYIKVDIAQQLISCDELQTDETKKFTQSHYVRQYLKSKPLEASRLLFEIIKATDVKIAKQGADMILKSIEAKEKYDAWKKKKKQKTKTTIIHY
ncbi:hypothetical protein [Spirosoma sp. KNUC1025]|uniref:hypothetical protein n=1 Tax=Spirosoma sp. KNUC1025 TaxID=2894082 RepID=UPI00386D3548|nr:hypothetical protein LN737_19280 [Spirosoma sp. KNUC1025]